MRIVSSLVAVLLLAAACGTPAGPEPPATAGDGAVVAAVDRAEPDAGAPLEELAEGLTAFAYALHTASAAPGENTVFSPLSIGLAFAMARAGAAGATAEEIDAVLGFPPGVHAAFNALEQAIVTADGPPPPPDPGAERDAARPPQPPLVALANGLFVHVGMTLEEPFLETLAASYGAGMHTVDFTDGDAAKELIDAWVAQQTAERIEEFFDEIDPRWLLVLASAVYLKADWATPFVEYPITDEPFTRLDGSEVAVPTMRRLDAMPYAQGDRWQAVELAYAGSELAMRVVVPTEVADPGALLAPDVLAGVGAGLGEQLVDLHLPQWDYGTAMELVGLLRELGMRAPFENADFSGISERPMFIDEAVHRTTITVDEWGTEAAAVTGLAFDDSGPPEPDTIVRADRPFAFVIVHTPSGTPLFTGTVADPAA